MGINVAKPIQHSISKVAISSSPTNLTTDGEEVIYNNKIFNHVKNTFFSNEPLTLIEGKRLRIKLTSGAVLRVGLTDKKPDEHDYLQSAIFEEEDGFGAGTSHRSLYLNNINYLCYGEPGAEREYLHLEHGPVWMYIIVIYGSPKISAVYDNMDVTWANFKISSIDIGDDGRTAVCGAATESERCIVEESINPMDTYLIRWSMNLKQSEQYKPAGKYLQYGFIRVALVNKKPRDIANIQLKDSVDNSIIWCTESAIRDFPYSGTLAFLFDIEKREITHNVLISSVDHVTIEENVDMFDKDFYLVIELSSGSLKVEHGRNIDVKQKYGSILYLSKCRELPNEAAIRYKIAATFHDPCMITYGSDPTAFVVEFRDKFAINDIKLPGLTDKITMLEETKAIQVLGVPTDFEEFELRSFFSRESACGGDEIASIVQSTLIKSAWIIEYKSTRVARKVLARKYYGINGNIVTVLPYYPVLGCSINEGNKPYFDREPFSIDPREMLDGLQRAFFQNRKYEIEKLQLHMADKVKIELTWDQDSDSDSECDEDDDDRGHIHIKCMVPQHEHSKLISWREDARIELERYFKDYLWDKTVKIENDRWDFSLEHLRRLSEELEFEFFQDNETFTIKLVASKATKLDDIALDLGNITVPEERKTIKLSKEQTEKYFTLQEEGETQHLRGNYKSVRFWAEDNTTVSYSGPKSEINEMHKDILNMMLNVKVITVILPNGGIKVAKKMEDEFNQILYSNGLKGIMKVYGNSLSVSVFAQTDEEFARKENFLQACTKNLILETDIEVSSTSNITDRDFNMFRSSMENEYAVSFEKTNKVIKVYSWFDCLDAVRKSTQTFIDSQGADVVTMYVTQDAAEYIDKWKMDKFDSKPSIENDGEYYSGRIIIEGVNNTKEKMKSDLQQLAREVKSMWLSISKPSLASFIAEIPLSRVVQEHECIISIYNGSSFASQGIPAISLLTTSSAMVKVIRADIHKVKAESIVIMASPDLNPKTGISKFILNSGGPDINFECNMYVDKHGDLTEGQVVVTSGGQLRCRAIIHAVGPQTKTSIVDDRTLLGQTIQKALIAAEREGFASIAIPDFIYAKSHEPIESSCETIVKAVQKHLDKPTGKRSLSTVFLCDCKENKIAEFVNVMDKSLNSEKWLFFKHGFELNTEGILDDYEQRPKTPRPQTASRPRTAGRRGRKIDDDSQRLSLRWDPTLPEQSMKLADIPDEDNKAANNNEEEVFKGGLPYKINISRTLHLHVIKGGIEKQQVDALVCPTFHFPELSGAVAGAMKRAAGPDFQEACRDLKSLESSQVKRTSGGTLQCKYVYHVLLETGWSKETFKYVYGLVKMSLQSAAKDKCTSIAIPAFGVGASKYPADRVAEAIITAVRKFAQKSGSTMLTDVYIVVYDQDYGIIRTFETCVPGMFIPVHPKQNRMNLKQESVGDNKVLEHKKLMIAPYMPGTTKTGSESCPVNDVVLIKVLSQKPNHVIHKAIQETIDREFIEKEIPFHFDHEEDSLSNDESATIRSLAKRYQLNHRIDTVNGKPVVKLSGLKSKVNRALPDFFNLVIRDIPDDRMKKKMGGQIVEYVQWLYDDKGAKREVKQEYIWELYREYKKGKNFRYMNDGIQYEVNVAKLEEYPVNDPTKRRRLYLKEKDKSSIKVPESWSIANNTESVATVELDPSEQEFQAVKAEFLRTGATPNHILKIVRIENKTLWMQYQSKKEQINKQNKSQDNERELWHGTNANAANVIIERGYDRGFVNVHKFGRGAYFAVKSNYSQGYATPDANGVQRMFYNDVLTGWFTTVAKEDATLPVRIQTQNEVILYDSAVDNVINPNMFIIFHDTQAYPRYMIQFK